MPPRCELCVTGRRRVHATYAPSLINLTRDECPTRWPMKWTRASGDSKESGCKSKTKLQGKPPPKMCTLQCFIQNARSEVKYDIAGVYANANAACAVCHAGRLMIDDLLSFITTAEIGARSRSRFRSGFPVSRSRLLLRRRRVLPRCFSETARHQSRSWRRARAPPLRKCSRGRVS